MILIDNNKTLLEWIGLLCSSNEIAINAVEIFIFKQSNIQHNLLQTISNCFTYNTITWQGEWTDLKGLEGVLRLKK